MYQIISFCAGEIEVHRSCLFFRLRSPTARPFDTPAVPKNPSAIRLVSAWIYEPEILNPSGPETDDCRRPVGLRKNNTVLLEADRVRMSKNQLRELLH